MRQSPAQWRTARASVLLPGADRREAAAALATDGEIHGRRPEREAVPVRGRSGAPGASPAG
ncbi:MAG: hypothetical protein A9Z00_06835 [Thermobacillus sp. ZCTH02-B1]|uniref:hypothetical protein n=1 Tax=Thermobacillus sp. ZCTH02-B1 TaxID=1858795 RepID=UPI000B5601EE|nr:hypothetical protein [Thermobacillus sp. ZCTH02-B1]OUM96055.1 MAG: hypothetical protein A9Z00_06835 [Thermobacillus sp. ZCTH02-B1]